MARVVVKARVTDLEDVPHYFVLLEGDDFEGVSTTVQVEIMQQTLLGGQLQDEDIPPSGFDDNFIYPGFGNINAQIQHNNGQHQEEEQINNPQQNNNPLQNDHLPNLNEDPMDLDQLLLIPDDQEGPKQEQQEEGQVDLDLQLSLSAPLPSSPSMGDESVQGSDKNSGQEQQ